MKKILFDLFSVQDSSGKIAGGYEFIYAIFKEIVNYHNKEIILYVFYNKEKENVIYDWAKNDIIEKSITVFDVKEIKELYQICEKNNIDVFYTGLPYQYTFKFASDNVTKIATFHGLREYECVDDEYAYYYYDYNVINRVLKNIIKQVKFIPFIHEKRVDKKRKELFIKNNIVLSNFDHILTDSHHSKYALINLFGKESKDIEVFYAPEKIRELEKNVAKKNYILITMCGRFRKNAYRGIKAIDNLQKNGLINDIKVIVTGKVSNRIKKEFINNENIQFIEQYVSNEELERLYANCNVFLFPTLNEGFGYPPLEAMAYGKTCVVGANTSLCEMCGDAVYYVNATDIFEMQTRILEALDKPIDEELVKSRYTEISNIQRKSLEQICQYISKGK